MSGNEPVFKIKADFLKSLAHPGRLAIIEFLKNREVSVGQMVKDLGIEQSILSKHLGTLRQVGILSSRQDKANVYYRIKNKNIFMVLRPVAEILRVNLQESATLLDKLGKA